MAELRRMRWPLWALTILFAAAGWLVAGVLWVFAVIALVLAVWNEVLIHRGRRHRAYSPEP